MTPDEYLGLVRATAWRAADYVPADRLEEVNRLIDHGDPAEGLCSLAWAIVNMQVRVPGDLVGDIVRYTREIIAEELLPDRRDFSLDVESS